ncbi:hypothetical protein ASN18_2101 [Candidatus Magnetominusculus xianensis]|uniref:Transposase n=1 Tax=Candidatus Magnetominusculus xianensis TaxID=1748249 RepID=A0ABR5SE21_9BACT|nr:hypothetical protein ASN18_2101 [Candidatus Magnetominusculus xianensis]
MILVRAAAVRNTKSATVNKAQATLSIAWAAYLLFRIISLPNN